RTGRAAADEVQQLARFGPEGEVLGEESVVVVIGALAVVADLYPVAGCVPGLAVVARGPDPCKPALLHLVDADAEQKSPVGQLDHVARAHGDGLGRESLGADPRALPGLAAVGRAMDVAVRVTVLVVDVLGQQMTGCDERPLPGTRQPLFPADHVLDLGTLG